MRVVIGDLLGGVRRWGQQELERRKEDEDRQREEAIQMIEFYTSMGLNPPPEVLEKAGSMYSQLSGLDIPGMKQQQAQQELEMQKQLKAAPGPPAAPSEYEKKVNWWLESHPGKTKADAMREISKMGKSETDLEYYKRSPEEYKKYKEAGKEPKEKEKPKVFFDSKGSRIITKHSDGTTDITEIDNPNEGKDGLIVYNNLLKKGVDEEGISSANTALATSGNKLRIIQITYVREWGRDKTLTMLKSAEDVRRMAHAGEITEEQAVEILVKYFGMER